MQVHIRYFFVYGSTQTYAEHLAGLLNTSAHPLEVPLPDDAAPVIALSPVHGPVVQAATYARKIQGRPVAVAAVGMTLLDVARAKDSLRKLVPEHVARFYLPGKLEFSTMSTAHRATLASISTMLRAKPVKSANDKAMIAAMGTDTDRMDFAELQPIVQWVQSLR